MTTNKTTAEIVAEIAAKHGIEYARTLNDELCEAATRLSGDDVEKDYTTNLLVELVRQNVITTEKALDFLCDHHSDTEKTRNVP